MMYHAGFRPDGVFTAPLKRGRVIVPLGLPAGTLIVVNCSMGMSNLPDFRSWTGPARSGFVSESGGGNCEMSTFVPIEAKGGIMLHPGPGPFAAGPGPLPACNNPPFPRSSLSLVPKLYQIEVLPMPLSLRKYTRHFSAINFLRQNETPSNPPCEP